MFEEEIKRGATYLDNRVPGWRDSINVDTLELSNCTRCVVGQLSGQSESSYPEWFSMLDTLGLTFDLSHEMGFALPAWVEEAEPGLDYDYDNRNYIKDMWAQLTDEWRDYIKETR